MHVLFGNLGDVDLQDVQVLALDQIEQKVQRALKGLQEDLQRLRRDVKVLGQLRHACPITTAKGISPCWGGLRESSSGLAASSGWRCCAVELLQKCFWGRPALRNWVR